MGVGEPDSVPAQRQPPSIFAGHDVFNLSNRKFRRWLLPPNENAIALTIQCWMMRLVEGYKRQSRPTEVLQPQNGLKGSWMPRLSRFIGSATTNNVGLEIGLGMVAFLTGGPIIAQRNVVLFVGSEAQLVEAVVRLPGIRACWYALGTATKWGAGLAAGPSFDFSIG